MSVMSIVLASIIIICIVSLGDEGREIDQRIDMVSVGSLFFMLQLYILMYWRPGGGLLSLVGHSYISEQRMTDGIPSLTLLLSHNFPDIVCPSSKV